MRKSGRRTRPYWTFRCQSCMRCMAYCPTRAVEVNYVLGIAAYWAASAIPSSAPALWLQERIPALSLLSAIPGWITESAWAIGVLAAAYPVVHQLLAVPWINRALTLATPTHYYRRYHEPETRLGDLK